MLRIKNELRKKSENEELPIYVRVTDGRRLNIICRTNETTFLKFWNTNENKLIDRITEVRDGRLIEKRCSESRVQNEHNRNVNQRLHNLNQLIEQAYKETSSLKNTRWLKELINPTIDDSNNLEDILVYIDYFISKKNGMVSKRYLSKIATIKNHLISFKNYHKIKELKVEEINEDFKAKYIDFGRVKNYSESYIHRNIKFVKTICLDAKNEGIKTHFQLDKLSSKNFKTLFQILSFEELNILKNTVYEHDYLSNARDWLIISAYCGQRVSDFMNFNLSMISERNSQKFIEFTQKKTKKQIVIPLHDEIIKILTKRDFDFPRKISDSKYNKSLSNG